jgi:hypothetical protein
MLSASRRLVYVNEPLNPKHPPGRSPGLLSAEVGHRYQYICPDNGAQFRAGFESMRRLRYNLAAELRRNRRPSDVVRALRHEAMFTHGRLTHRRLMVADPFATFSAEWFTRELGFRVVLLVRHPLAIVGSRKRLGWRFDHRKLFDQPLLVRDRLSQLTAQWPEGREAADDIIDESAKLWRLIYGAALQQRERTPEIMLVRHEDLSLEPVPCFAELYERLGLPFTSYARRAIDDATNAQNPSGLSAGNPHGVRLDSRANINSWRERLTEEEAARVLQITGPIAQELYPGWPGGPVHAGAV